MEHASEGCTCEGKFCKDCEQTKCLGYMQPYKSKTGKICYRLQCRLCHKQKWNPIRAENAAAWKKANPDKSRALALEWKEANRERAKEWRKANPERVTAYRQEWYGATPGRAGDQYRQWKEANPEKEAVRVKNRRAREKQAEGNFTSHEWEQLKLQYDHTCLRCERKEPEIKLTADHVIPLSKGGDNYIGNIQPLCHSCNSGKGANIIDYRHFKKTT
jgi:5-methylcytosine-specific restriction endonuclease McrA